MVEISVIIPTYNRPINLKRAINSVLNQTYENWELLIVDDNNPGTESRTETQVLVKEYCKNDNRIQYYQHEKNKNGASARNTGISFAKGRYIAFLDDDDEYLPDKLKIQYEMLENPINDQFDGAYSGCIFVRDGKANFEYNNINSGEFLLPTLACEFQMGSGSNLFLKSETVKKLNGFDESFYRHQDYEFLVRFFQQHKLLGIKKPLFKVEQSAMHLNIPNSEKAYEYRMKYLGKYEYLIKDMNQEDANYIYYKNFVSLSQIAIKEKKYRLAIKWYGIANKKKKMNYNDIILIFMMSIYSILPKSIKNVIKRGR